MSFGYSVGDFLAVIQLTNTLRKRFVSAPAEFKSLSEDVRQLSTVLRDIDDLDPNDGLSDRQKQRLNELSQACAEALRELQQFVDKYHEIDTSGINDTSRPRRAWKRIRWDQVEAQSIQSLLQGHIGTFTLFMSGLNVQLNISQKAAIDEIGRDREGEEREKILIWLSDINFGAKHTDCIRGRQPGTSEWIVGTTQFEDWIKTPRKTLFAHGIPGVGKTITASVVIEKLKAQYQHNEDVAIAYVYFNFKERIHPDELFLNLLMQLASKMPVPTKSVKDLYNKHKQEKTRPSSRETSDALHSVAAMYSKTFILVDALDECSEADGCRRKVLEGLLDLQKSHAVSLFVTSRPDPQIMEMFNQEDYIEIEARKEDIESFVDGRLASLPLSVQRSQALQDEVKSVIAEAVDGMFLLAQLYLKALEYKVTTRDIRKALEQFRRRASAAGEDQKALILAEAYGDTMKRIQELPRERKELAVGVLQWVTCAKRPLTTVELQHALAVNEGDSDIDEDSFPEVQDMLTVCAGLVTVNHETNAIRLVHYTAQEYFERSWETWFPDAQSQISSACLTYLTYEVFNAGPCRFTKEYELRLKRYSLFEYASGFWGEHCRSGFRVTEHILRLLTNKAKVAACAQGLIRSQAWERVRLPWFEAEWGYKLYRDEINWKLFGLLRIDFDYSRECWKGLTALHLTAYFGLDAVLSQLLDRGYSHTAADIDRRTPLSWAAAQGHNAVVSCLLQRGANPNFGDIKGRIPWLWAAYYGHCEVATQLFPRSYIMNPSDKILGKAVLEWMATKNGEAWGRIFKALAFGADLL